MNTVLLDSGPLSLLSNPINLPDVVACRAWAQAMRSAGHRVIVPEIIDYELRRELIRAKKLRSLRFLDRLAVQFQYLALTSAVMKQAAEFWAVIRQAGLPTAGPDDLDADVILAAQARALGDPNVIVATTNIRHLARFVPADLWTNIVP